jgi:uncharacterized protein YegL
MCLRYQEEVKISADETGDCLPLAVVMTDGSPSDTALFNRMCEILAKPAFRFSKIIGCAAGPKAKVEPLKRFATDIVTMETMDTESFQKFWVWVSDSLTQYSHELNPEHDELPPTPPTEVRLVY